MANKLTKGSEVFYIVEKLTNGLYDPPTVERCQVVEVSTKLVTICKGRLIIKTRLDDPLFHREGHTATKACRTLIAWRIQSLAEGLQEYTD